MQLSRRSEPFDSDEFLYELKIDGFRALFHLQDGKGELVSRKGGEIACIDDEGRPIFTDLLFRKSTCIFVAFDLLYLNRNDLRSVPLIERKRELRRLLHRKRSRILYLGHVEKDGRLLFEQIVKMDLEGMVCKRKSSPYRVTEKPSPYWIKVKNPRYSQLEGREELFERAK
jgi:bifunctional non-homologous end joining protein LigD